MNAFVRHAMTIHMQEQDHIAAMEITFSDLIPDRARAIGCTDFESYCDMIDREATAHLEGTTRERINHIRLLRRPRPYFDQRTATHCLSISVNRNRTMFAKVDAIDWIAMQEMGATGTWQGVDTFSGIYVYTSLPLKRQAATQKVTVSRLILGLGPNEQVRFLDGDSLNLRRNNLAHAQGRPARHNARQVVREAAARRDQMTAEGRTFDAFS